MSRDRLIRKQADFFVFSGDLRKVFGHNEFVFGVLNCCLAHAGVVMSSTEVYHINKWRDSFIYIRVAH